MNFGFDLFIESLIINSISNASLLKKFLKNSLKESSKSVRQLNKVLSIIPLKSMQKSIKEDLLTVTWFSCKFPPL